MSFMIENETNNFWLFPPKTVLLNYLESQSYYKGPWNYSLRIVVMFLSFYCVAYFVGSMEAVSTVEIALQKSANVAMWIVPPLAYGALIRDIKKSLI